MLKSALQRAIDDRDAYRNIINGDDGPYTEESPYDPQP
jgi:hypothetical protein